MLHLEYLKRFIGTKIDFDRAYSFQCVDLVRHYCSAVWNKVPGIFGGTAIAGWNNRLTTFKGCTYVEGFSPNIPVGSVVIFKPNVTVKVKVVGGKIWRNITLGKAGHTGIVDYIDGDGVIRLLEQNGGSGNGNGIGNNAIRLYGYQGKGTVAGFIIK